MKYLAVMLYDCGCPHDANYAFHQNIEIEQKEPNRDKLDKVLRELSKKHPEDTGEHEQCFKQFPIEVILYNPNLEEVCFMTSIPRDGEEKIDRIGGPMTVWPNKSS